MKLHPLSTLAALVPATVISRNRQLDRRLRRSNVSLKHWKAVKNGIVSALVLGFGAFAILQGAPTDATTLLTLAIVGALNGFDWLEYAAAAAEVSRERSDEDDDK